jgi:hypothetical protein
VGSQQIRIAMDNDYIPDPIERGEMAAEAWADEYCLPGGKCRCYICNEIFDESKGQTLSPDPYAPLACPACAAKDIIAEQERQRAQDKDDAQRAILRDLN